MSRRLDGAFDALDRLIKTGCLVLRQPGPTGRRAVCVTVAGEIRYAELGEAVRAR